MTDDSTSDAARKLSRSGASKGGQARAKTLTSAERSENARRAVQARWAKAGKPPKEEPDATTSDELPHSLFRGELSIGDVAFEVHVLNNGTRVLKQREVVRLLSGGRESGHLSRYLSRLPGADVEKLMAQTVQFRVPGSANAIGYEATLLIEICDLYLAARDRGDLRSEQLPLAQQAEIVIRATAKVGIVALIDEATGYQRVRERNALQLKLQAFIADEMAEWARMFPTEFWLELARLEGVEYSPRSRPLRWGRYVMMFVYDAVDPDVGKELRRKNPDPQFRRNHHQWLREHGREKVNNQIQQVIAIMKLCDDMPDFKAKFAKVFQKTPLQLELWNELV